MKRNAKTSLVLIMKTGYSILAPLISVEQFLSANYCCEQGFPLGYTKAFFIDLRLCLNCCD